MKVLVLGGGNSPEREVSLRSAKSVADAAREAGYEVVEADPRDGYDILDSIDNSSVVLPILHGEGGEDGSIQLEFEKRKLAFLGASSESSKNCFDKWTTKEILQKNNVIMPQSVRVTRNDYLTHSLSQIPHVLKVVHGGSSIGTLIVRNPNKMSSSKTDELFSLENNALLEELIEGVEITVPILDMQALGPIEIQPPQNGEFDYQNKYNGKTKELCPPPSLTPAQILVAQKIAESVHKFMDCRHLSRVDIMMDKAGNFYVLEINTIPGLTDQSLYPRSAAEAGLSMPALVNQFVVLIKRDYRLQ